MVIGQGRRLQPCSSFYDRRVAGVVSGGSGMRPALVLGRARSNCPVVPLALTGTVYCKVDASYACIEEGDLLTTSATRGYAMKGPWRWLARSADQACGGALGSAEAQAFLAAMPSVQALMPALDVRALRPTLGAASEAEP
jgi:hypothetical protein